MRISLSAVLWCMIVLSASGQTGTRCSWSISGTVLDEHDNSPLDYATIYIKEADRGVVADSLGQFQINDLCATFYTLFISHLGCESVEQTIRVAGHEVVIFRLEHHAELLQTIELQARRIHESATTATSELDRKTILRSSGHALGEALEQLPGVSALQTGPTVFKPVIQGLHSDRLLILKDGLRLESQQWGLDHAPEIDPNSAARIAVVKGAAAVQYGTDAVGGVILVESDALPSERVWHGDAGISGIENGRQLAFYSSIKHGFGKGFGAQFQGSFRRAGDARAADYYLTNTGLSESSLSAMIGYAKGLRKLTLTYTFFATELGILRSAHIGNLTDLSEALGRNRPLVIEDFSYHIDNPKQHVVHQTAQLKGQTSIKHIGILSGQYAVQWNNREEYDIRRGGRDDIPALDLHLQTHTAEFGLAHEAIGNLRGKLSVHWNYQRNENISGTGVRPLVPNYARVTPAISWVEKWTRSEVELEGGVRYEYSVLSVKRYTTLNALENPEFHFHNFAASAGIRWTPEENITVLSHLGYTQRAPRVNELFSEGLHHGAAAIEEGDRSLISEKAIKWVSGVEWEQKSVRFNVSLFAQRIGDFIYLRPTGEPRLTIRGAFPVFQYQQDDVALYGGDASVWWQIAAQWSWRSELALLRARNLGADEDLIGMPADRMRHTLIWNHANSGTEAEIGIQYVWKQYRVPADVDYLAPPDGYALVQIGAGTTLIRDKLDVHMMVRNLLNASYREYLNRLRYYADDAGRSIELRLHYTF